MARVTTKLLACAVVAGVCAAAVADDAVDLKRQAQIKLLTYRAARADAIRKLAERIRGLTITSETTVQDFVTTSDRIETAMRAWLSGMREVGKPTYMEDGTCEVTMEVTIEDLIVHLKRFRKAYYKGDKFKLQDFEKIKASVESKTLRETGMGAPRDAESLDDGLGSEVSSGNLNSLRHLSGRAKKFWLANVKPQGRLMAVRGARVEGLRRLGERIGGVFITSETTVKDFVAESDQIDTSMQTFLRGAREKRIRYHDDELIVEVDMEITLRTVYSTLKSWGEVHFKGDKVKMKKLERLVQTTKDAVLKETGMAVPPERYLKGRPEGFAEVRELVSDVPPWATQSLRASGQAAVDADSDNPAQAKLMAYRAAELDARRKLAEQIQGLTISSRTTVRDFVAESDEIRTRLLAFQQGAHVIEGSKKLMEDGTAQVDVEIALKPLWNLIVHYRGQR
jgi:hypothetical protein